MALAAALPCEPRVVQRFAVHVEEELAEPAPDPALSTSGPSSQAAASAGSCPRCRRALPRGSASRPLRSSEKTVSPPVIAVPTGTRPRTRSGWASAKSMASPPPHRAADERPRHRRRARRAPRRDRRDDGTARRARSPRQSRGGRRRWRGSPARDAASTWLSHMRWSQTPAWRKTTGMPSPASMPGRTAPPTPTLKGRSCRSRPEIMAPLKHTRRARSSPLTSAP